MVQSEVAIPNPESYRQDFLLRYKVIQAKLAEYGCVIGVMHSRKSTGSDVWTTTIFLTIPRENEDVIAGIILDAGFSHLPNQEGLYSVQETASRMLLGEAATLALHHQTLTQTQFVFYQGKYIDDVALGIKEDKI